MERNHDFETAWNNLVNEVYRLFRIPQIVEWLENTIDKVIELKQQWGNGSND